MPPKGGYTITEVEQESIFQYLTDGKKQKYQISQNGVKYRSICGDCNNRLLGSKFDPELNEFAVDIATLIKTNLYLPYSIIRVKAKPALLCKAIVGHMLSATGYYGVSKIDERFRAYFLNDLVVRPVGFKVFYWIYPYSSIRILRDVGMPQHRGCWEDFRKGMGMFSILKYFPVGFIVSNIESYEGLEDLTRYCGDDLQDEASIPINLNDVRPEYWPEAGEDNIMLGGETLGNGVSAIPRRKGF